MSRKFARNAIGQFTTTKGQEGNRGRSAKRRADIRRRLTSDKRKMSGRHSLRSSVNKVVITKQSKKFTDRYKRRRRG